VTKINNRKTNGQRKRKEKDEETRKEEKVKIK
jgi:hypothetical protein